jgi:exo-beta-1,3-glucanase (GH17 family)
VRLHHHLDYLYWSPYPYVLVLSITCHILYGEILIRLIVIGVAPPKSTSAPASSSSTPKAVVPSSSPSPVVPTPLATTCPTPGVYTIPATTVTLTESTTVCAATSTSVPSGTHTVGGVTTVVTTSTTVVCPYATVSTSSGVVTSTILTTTYVCPSAGTYTVVPPMTTSCSTESIWVYPTPASYAPGTYTQSEIVTTITETDYVIFCPFTSPAPAPPKSTSAPVTTAAPAPAPAKSSTAAPASSSSSSGSSSSSSSGALGSSGDQWAITYTPYNSDTGACLNAAQVLVDIALIKLKGFTTVRVYSTDCNTLENVGSACEISGLKMILGIFISDTGISGAQDQVTAITSWAKWDLVELVVIGNEAVFSGYCSASELAGFISSCKSTFASSGYSGPCTTTEPLDIWQESTAALCEVVDVVGANIHPFFNADVSCDQAGSFVASQLAIVDGLCSGKTGINLETGWPTDGSCNGAACPGQSEQATAVAGIKAAAGGRSAMFSFSNDLWKPLGSFDCEQSWGMINLFPDL